MISKEDAREEIERGRRPAIGTNSHFFDLEAGDQQPTNNRRTANTSSSHSPCPQDTRPADDRLVNVLRERRHLLSRSTAQKTLLSSSTPLRPDRGADAGNQVVEKRLKDVVANRKVDTQRQISVERRSEDEALPAWSGRNIGTSQEINLRAQRAFETHHTVELRISSGLEFCFKFEHLDSPLKKSTLDQFLRSAQARLRDMLFWHGKPLEEGRQSCSNENCVGLEAYLDCWVELEAALLKAEQYEGSSSHPFFVRLLAARLYELLRVPTCTLGTVWLDSELDPNDLYSFFCKDNLSWERRTVQAIIETASALRKALPKCVHVK
ncbi:hypothetical protein BIW11_03388 [Tropilaelaps mercedesae]|uniref:Uncharacterized protein n=1 Tax=Tropilaelaps mercedesae TaxID=418985 RepID=A0A1V9XMU9_9ACAR|nr:hypothetical protein BIW11_03388 [Tropilaelaps mercedesae]